MDQQNYITSSVHQTYAIASDFAKKLHDGDVVLFYGDLGAGKTTFIQGLAKGLGVEKRIISPTFIIVRSYERENGGMLYHLDLYRTTNENDIIGLGFSDFIKEKNAIVVVEWPEKLGSLLPKTRWEVHCHYVDDTTRKFIISKSN